MAANAPDISLEEAIPAATAAGPPQRAERAPRMLGQARGRGQEKGDVHVFQHSNLLYWWVVWAYGFACAGLTYVQGVGVPQLAATAEKQILFHPSPWLGISYIALVLFVVVFTNVKARGVYSFVLVLLAAGIAWGAAYIPGIDMAMGWASMLRVHLNLAFYLAFSSVMMLIWLFVIVFIDHFTWWRFSPGQVIEEHRVGHATGHAYNTEGMVVRRLPDDFFRHRLLGLGTGDFVVSPPNAETFEIHNVWKANRKQRRIEDMIAKRITETAPARSAGRG